MSLSAIQDTNTMGLGAMACAFYQKVNRLTVLKMLHHFKLQISLLKWYYEVLIKIIENGEAERCVFMAVNGDFAFVSIIFSKPFDLCNITLHFYF